MGDKNDAGRSVGVYLYEVNKHAISLQFFLKKMPKRISPYPGDQG
jgi:hypothetical protein